MALNDTLLLMMATERHQDMLREAEAERLRQTLKQQPTHWRTKMKQTILYVSFIIGLLALGFVLSVQLTFASVGDPLPVQTAPIHHQGEDRGQSPAAV